MVRRLLTSSQSSLEVIPIAQSLQALPSSNGLTSASYWFSDSIYTVKTEIQINNFIEKSQEQLKDEIIKLEHIMIL